jgi:hypothetical protein
MSFATYLYCLLRGKSAPSLKKVPPGLPHTGEVRLLEATKDLWLVVADAPLKLYNETSLEAALRDLDFVSRCAVAHQTVISHFARTHAVAPMKLFTLFQSDARAVAHVEKDRTRIARTLDRIDGCEEYGVRLLLDEARALRQVERQAHQSAGSTKTGAGYLMRKKQVRDRFRNLGDDARAAADQAFDALATRSADATRRAPPQEPTAGGRLLLDAAFQVKRKRAATFKAAAKKLAQQMEGEGYAVALTGPWPPYHFVTGAS